MRFVIDNSVVMRWLFGDGEQAAIEYSNHILDLLAQEEHGAIVPCIWALEGSLRCPVIGSPVHFATNPAVRKILTGTS